MITKKPCHSPPAPTAAHPLWPACCRCQLLTTPLYELCTLPSELQHRLRGPDFQQSFVGASPLLASSLLAHFEGLSCLLHLLLQPVSKGQCECVCLCGVRDASERQSSITQPPHNYKRCAVRKHSHRLHMGRLAADRERWKKSERRFKEENLSNCLSVLPLKPMRVRFNLLNQNRLKPQAPCLEQAEIDLRSNLASRSSSLPYCCRCQHE